MKKILISLAVALLSITAIAQTPTGLNISAGFIHNRYVTSGDVPKFDNAWYFGPFIEVGYDLELSQHSLIYAGVRYEFMHNYCGAYGYTWACIPVGASCNTYRHYIDIPIKYKFQFNVGYTTKMFIDLGPTVNFWVGDNAYYQTSAAYVVTRSKCDMFKEVPNAYQRVNVSIGTNVGFLIRQHSKVYVGYDYGGLISFTNPQYYTTGQIHQIRIGYAYVF